MIINYRLIETNHGWNLRIDLKDNEGVKSAINYQLFNHSSERKKRLYHDLNIRGDSKKTVKQEIEDASLLYKLVYYYNNSSIYEKVLDN